MPQTSFVQTDFRGGRWSPNAQGRMHDPKYKSAMAVCLNSMPLYNAPWTRRPGFLWGGNTRAGQPARLIDCFLKFSEPFQLEFTNGFMRAHVGNGFVFTPDVGVTIKSISTATPAIVTLNGTIPSGWNNYDTVTFDMIAPSTSPILSGRQFVIQSISGNTFAIYDAMTGLPINGDTQPYTAPTLNGVDRVYKILELTTPWPQPALAALRLVQTDTNAVILHPSTPPQNLTVPPFGNFALAAQSFKDGPYFDINETTTTLTPSGTSGSITFTASSITGINNNLGFAPTDVGRMLRFQSGPPAWASGTTYSNGTIVTGSDNNIYSSQIGGNIGNNPTTDNGTNWVVTGQTIIWVWAIITAVNSTTQVTATVQPAAVTNRGGAAIPGDTLFSTAASASWQLGLYSATTGYPSVGVYYEGRLLLAGQVVTNRFDGSCANDPFNFAPSAPDGTVGDGNALSEESNAPKINQVLWMLPTQQGVLTGGQNGEWIITASNFGDPLTPTSVQWHRVSTYGCANIEPQQTEMTTCFVQREVQRVMNYANYPYGEASGWYADNLSEMADDLCAPGIAEIRWQQEPSHFLWARCNDGSLIGTTFQHSHDANQNYNGWHNHSIGGGRTCTSISTGPSSDGLTTTLYTIAYNPTTELYEYLELGHIFDATQASWAQGFTDGAAQIGCATSNNTGITLYGMYEIIGETITVSMGGLDLGDYVVQGPDGHITLTFGTPAAFTLSYVEGLSNGTDYGVFALPIQPPDANVYTNDAFGAYNPTDSSGVGTSASGGMILVQDEDWFITVESNGIRVYNASTFNVESTATSTQIFYGSGISMPSVPLACYHPGNNCLYTGMGGGDNSTPIARIDMDTLRNTGSFGEFSNSFLNGPAGFGAAQNSMIPFSLGTSNYIATAFITGGSNHNNGIGVIDADAMQYVGSTQIIDSEAYLCPGIVPGTFYCLGTPVYGSASTTALGVYVLTVAGTYSSFLNGGNSLSINKSGTISPASVDATWTHFSNVIGVAFDPTDNNCIMYVNTTDSVTHTAYWVKFNPNTAAIVAVQAETNGAGCPFTSQNMAQLQMPAGTFMYERGTGTLYTLALTAASQSLTTASFPTVTDSFGNSLYWPERNAIISSVEVAYTTGEMGLVRLGMYMQTNNSFTGWGLITPSAPTSNANWPPPDQFNVPMSIGVNYTSAGQLLRPDYGPDAGAAAGPAFGKKRRQHWFAAAVVNGQNFNISTDNTFPIGDATDTVYVMDEDENLVEQPNLYTGTLSTTMPDNYSWDSQIAWQVTRPTPLTISAMGGYIAAQDK
jgi:hypothetical protein